MDNFQLGAVTPFQYVQQRGCCCERTETYSPLLLKRCYCTSVARIFLNSYLGVWLASVSTIEVDSSHRKITTSIGDGKLLEGVAE